MKISDQLRQVIERAPMTRYRISKLSGVHEATLARFMQGRQINGDTIDMLAEVLGLKLAPKRSGKAGRR